MNPANFREAVVEARADESEGADILLVGIACFESFGIHLKQYAAVILSCAIW